LPGNDNLWRRFIDRRDYWTWDDDVHRWIPNRHYLRFDPDLSCFWDWHLAINGWGPESVFGGDSRFTVVGQLAIGGLRKLGYRVSHTPNELPDIGCAHCSVDWPLTAIPPNATAPDEDHQKAFQTQIAREFTWIYGGPPNVPPPAGA
jgi:hypothetical protein